jgi:hypothetical protein
LEQPGSGLCVTLRSTTTLAAAAPSLVGRFVEGATRRVPSSVSRPWSALAIPCSRHALPSPGSLQVCRSRLHRYYGVLRLPLVHRASLGSPHRSALPLLRSSMPLPWWSAPRQSWTVLRWPVLIVRRREDLPGSWPILARLPCSLTPAGRVGATVGSPLVLPASPGTESAPAVSAFEARSHGPRARCLRFAAEVALVHARLATGWAVSLGRAGLSPGGSDARFRCDYFISYPPRPGLAWRTPGSVSFPLRVAVNTESSRCR